MHKWRAVEPEPEFVEGAVVVNETAGGNETATGLNEMQTSWGPYLSIASMVPNVTILLLNAAFGHHFRFGSSGEIVKYNHQTCVMLDNP